MKTSRTTAKSSSNGRRLRNHLQNGIQAIATAYGDYAKKSFEDTKSFVEKLSGVKSLDKAIEVQTEYAKTAYETFVAESQKIAGLYSDLAKQTFKPFEGLVAKFTPGRRTNAATRFPRNRKSPAARPGFFVAGCFSLRCYFATRSFDSDVPIVLKTVVVWLAVVTWKNLSGAAGAILHDRLLAIVPVLTWIA